MNMKSEQEINRAIHLLSLLLSGQVQLKVQLPPAALQNAHGVVRALQWTLSLPNPLDLEFLLRDIERAMDGPTFNPQSTMTE